MVAHRFAKLVAFATFVLLVVGGTVNPTGSSLACPEPTFVCHGDLFPPMVGGVLYEHGHRLAAMTVGLLQIALTLLLLVDHRRLALLVQPWRWRREIRGSRSRDKRLGLLLLAMVIAQGALGAITVKYKLPWFISTAHLLLGMSYFATLIYTAFRLRPQPSVISLDQHETRVFELGGARRWIAIACVTVFVQLLLGALVRHLGAALVCLGMPTCTLGGDWWPDTSVQHLHMVHRGFGVVTAVVTTIAAVQVLRAARSWLALRALALVAPVLVCAQVALGVLTVMTVRAVPLAVGHFAGAAALWALWMSAWFMTRTRATLVVPEARVVRTRSEMAVST
jgi:heme A synthase